MPGGEIKNFIDWLTSEVIRKNKDQLLVLLVKRIPDYITPNLLSYFRLFFTNILLYLLLRNSPTILGWGIIIYLFCKILDLLDGSLARYRNQQTTIGEILDPLIDRLLNLVGLLILISTFHWQALWVYWFINLFSIIIFLINLLLLSGQFTRFLKFNYWRKVIEVVGLFITLFLLILELIKTA